MRLTDQRIAAGLEVVVDAPSGELACGQIDGRSAEKAVRAIVCGEQRADFVLEVLVAVAAAPQKRVALRGRAFERRLQQLIDVVPAFVVHSQRAASRSRPKYTRHCPERESRRRPL